MTRFVLFCVYICVYIILLCVYIQEILVLILCLTQTLIAYCCVSA